MAPPSGRFAAGRILQGLWHHLAAGLQRDGIAAIVAPSRAGLQRDGDCSDCGAILRQGCSGMGIAVIGVPSSGGFAVG